jgi:hypothetical protein
MKSIFAALVLALLVVGCDRSGPVDASADQTTEATFSELSMYKITIETEAVQIISADSGKHQHDSLRNGRMMDSLKTFLKLSDAQFDSVKLYGATLFATLGDIRTQVMTNVITRDSARVFVAEARNTFVLSVKSILSAEQLTLFETWLTRHWLDDHRGGRGPGGRGHGGRGGHGRPGGPGGHGGPGRP